VQVEGKRFGLPRMAQVVAAAFVCCGSGPDSAEAVARIQGDVYDFYGGSSTRRGLEPLEESPEEALISIIDQ